MLKPILLVEDNSYDLELTLLALEKSDLANDVISVRDGEEALAYLRRESQWSTRKVGNPAVVLLDLKLPKIDGVQVLEAMRADEKLREVRVVVLTSSKEERDLVRSYDAGASAFVVKPIDFSEFIKAVADLGVFWAVLNEPPPGSAKVARERINAGGRV
ncbi:response regulator [Burkholderia sp. PAMC 26561]|uniref:response regulator n=1 Tax=Burkholderia sp. PAMC 26561 TaxID=1795043 RepID=UPI00076B0213|nr:response regulator [Burkholderia sp. PAMC 26561]AME22800.1 two-component system response regulator [Burkholderia sp. PAMC 26561]